MAFPIGISELTPKGAELQLYSNAYVFVNGQLLTQESSVTVNKKNNSKPMHTLHKGFAGVSKGSGTVEISIDNAIPTKDFELHPDLFLITGEVVEIGIVVGARQTLMKGFLLEANYSHSVNDASRLSINFICRLEAFE